MNRAVLGVIACAVVAGSGLYFWSSRAEPEAPGTAPQISTPTLPESSSPGGMSDSPDSMEHRPPPASPPTDEVTAPGDPASSPMASEQRAVAIAHLADAMRPVYEDAGQEVGLDDPETEALIRLLAEQQLRLSDANLDSAPDAAATYQALKNQFQQEIQLQIGPDRAQRLANYQDTMNARYEVEEARRALEAASQPMTESQRKAWIRAAIDHGAFVREPDLLGGGSSVAVMQELLARIDQRDQKLLSVARGILDPQQLHSYETYISERRNRFDEDIRRQEQEAARR